MNPSIGAISKWKYLLLLKLWCEVVEITNRGAPMPQNMFGWW